jgi:putative phosphoribosyl transferase
MGMSKAGLIFADRKEAGQRLAAILPALDPASSIVIALPRGGVPVAAEICSAFGLPLDLIFVRKIGAPGQPELAVGAITNGAAPMVTVNDRIAKAFGLTPAQVSQMGQSLLPEIARRREIYLAGRAPLPRRGKTLVVVDDGVATGATLLASLKALRKEGPKAIIVAMPVGPSDLAQMLAGLADEVFCLSDLRHFGAVGGAYRMFPQVDDDTVGATLARYAPTAKG